MRRFGLMYTGDPVLLPERRTTATTDRGPRGRVPGGDRVLPAGTGTDPDVPRERGLHHRQGGGSA